MTECLPDLPRYIRQRGDEWQGADHQNGPWRPIPAPQLGLPWPTDGPAVKSREPASVAAEATPTLAERLALAVCRGACPIGGPCPVGAICSDCRRDSAAVAHELSSWLRERHAGSSQVADLLDGVGCHPPRAGQAAQEAK